MREFPYAAVRRMVYGATVETTRSPDSFSNTLVIAGWHRTTISDDALLRPSPQYAAEVEAAVKTYRGWPVPPPRRLA